MVTVYSQYLSHERFPWFQQVFHGLLKAHAQEVRTIVRQALDILTPVMPHRMEDGNVMRLIMVLIYTLCE